MKDFKIDYIKFPYGMRHQIVEIEDDNVHRTKFPLILTTLRLSTIELKRLKKVIDGALGVSDHKKYIGKIVALEMSPSNNYGFKYTVFDQEITGRHNIHYFKSLAAVKRSHKEVVIIRLPDSQDFT